MAQDITVKYTDKNFDNLREQLIELTKNYYPDTYNDFSPTSPGMMFIEMAAYVGDILSFYQDSQLQETYLQYAQDPSNLYTLAYMMGYKPKVTTASSVEIEISQRVQATGANYEPDWDQALSLSENIQLETGQQKFIIDKGVDFSFSSSYDPTDVTIYSISGDYPSEYLLTKKATARSGEIVSTTQAVGSLTKFYTITINDTNIIGILDIVDSEGNTWYEVPYLGQETVYTETAQNSTTAPYSLAVLKTPRRFTTRLNSTGELQIQFGAGSNLVDNEDILPNATNIGSPHPASGVNRLDYAYDPSNFLYSDSYGISPSNTTLTIRYLRGGGIESNVEANTLTTTTNVTATATDNTYIGTLSFNNPKAATGGKDGDTVEELRQNAMRAFNEQGRIVTKQDFGFRAMSMPSSLGGIAKAFVTGHDDILPANDKSLNPLEVNLYVLSYDSNKKLTASSTDIKNNLKTYLSQYMVLTDTVVIKDAFIINIGIKYDIITLPNYNSREVLRACTSALKNYFNISKWSINQPINLSRIYTLLDRVKGVQTVQDIKIVNKTNGNYSTFGYDIEGATKNNIVYPSLDPMIFEIRYPDTDIQGRITTL